MSKIIKAVLTDIEGTSTSINFVHDVLFEYSRMKLEPYLLHHKDTEQMRRMIFEILHHPQHCSFNSEFYADGTQLQIAIGKLKSWIDQDLKITILKDLQGMVWEEGYKKKAYTGHLFPEAYKILKQLHEKGLRLYVYSSGSVHAQRLLFKYSDFGDNTSMFSGFFDTRIGPKRDPKSYKKIYSIVYGPSSRITDPSELLFISDVQEEVDAALEAGLSALKVNPETGITGAQINQAGIKFAAL
ncbi:MAG: acireductone synthase [Candidatus Caenarcaniphilales bacterium]|jgi:enolase-phosphatase E1|nr:acireductone synthase [Candidatus Caenarcaniphilales bacterium]